MYATILGVIKEIHTEKKMLETAFYRHYITLLNNELVIVDYEEEVNFCVNDMIELNGQLLETKNGTPYFEVHGFKILGKKLPVQRRLTDFENEDNHAKQLKGGVEK